MLLLAIIAIALFAIDAGITYLGWHYTEHHRKPRWERRAQREPVVPMDFTQEIRVRDLTRRGPEIQTRSARAVPAAGRVAHGGKP